MAAAAPKGETDTGVCYSGGSRAASGSILNLTYFRSGITRVSNAKKKKKCRTLKGKMVPGTGQVMSSEGLCLIGCVLLVLNDALHKGGMRIWNGSIHIQDIHPCPFIHKAQTLATMPLYPTYCQTVGARFYPEIIFKILISNGSRGTNH